MAKTDNLSFFEQHVEKVVLAVCGLLLLLAVMRYGFSSTVEVQVPGASEAVEVSVDELDAMLAAAAQKADDYNTNTKIEVLQPPITEPEEIRKEHKGFPGRALASLASPAAPSRLDDDERPPELINTRLSDLVNALSSFKEAPTYVQILRELPRTGGQLADVDIARAVAIFPIGDTLAKWKALLKGQAVVRPIVVLDVEVQRQENRPGASWEPVSSKAIKATYMDDGEEIKIPSIPAYTGGNMDEINNALLDMEAFQEHILQPDYYDVWGQGQWDDWRRNLPPEPLKELGAEVRRRPVNAYSPRTGTGRGRTPRSKRQRPVYDPPMDPMMGMDPTIMGPAERRTREPSRKKSAPKKTPRKRTRRPDPMEGMPDMMDDMYDPMGQPGRSPKKKTPKRTPKKTPKKTPIEPEEAPMEEIIEVPHIQDQMDAGKVLVWVHDTSIEPLKSYRFRLRLKLHNPLLGQEDFMKKENRQDGLTQAVFTPWSQWSAPASVREALRFFVTGVSRRAADIDKGVGKVRVTVFTRILGQRVMEDFVVTKGQSIGRRKDRTLPNPDWDPNADESEDNKRELTVPVSFATGAVLVDVDFGKTVISNGVARNSVEIVYQESGKLKTGVRVTDLAAGSPRRSDYESLLEEAKKDDYGANVARDDY